MLLAKELCNTFSAKVHKFWGSQNWKLNISFKSAFKCEGLKKNHFPSISLKALHFN
jgi:hypothetical protein